VTEPVLATTDADGERVYRSPVGTFPSVTRILNQVNQPALDRWKQKALVEALLRDPELVKLAVRDPDQVARRALSDNRAASLGTSVHALTERADLSELDLDGLDEPKKAMLAGYIACRDSTGWKVVHSEATVINPLAGYGGTLDRILDVPDVGRVVADVKTSRSVYPDMALQLAAYANATSIWSETELAKMPDGLRTDVALVIHVRPEGTSIVRLNLGRGQGGLTAWAAFTSLCCLWRWRHRSDIVG
jgi:hypothetical protein